MYEFLYYITISLSICSYFISLRIFRVRLITYSTLMYVLAYLFIMLHGYEIASGNAIRPALNHGFDNEIYFLYIAYAILSPLGLIAGNLYGKSFRVECHAKGGHRGHCYIMKLYC